MNNLLFAINSVKAWIGSQSKVEKGATATEYSLLVGLIALVLVAGVGFFGGELDKWFSSLGTTVSGW
ncbi:Flp family type IVb pilin [Pseudarthrobacter enclensis]|uniref:Flp family type IVb pilin n=1 Tax=Pseudarthrobacter enclensis TaxID=993070 RepID=UPI003EE38135